MAKCEFGRTLLVYLGYIVGGGVLIINPSKVEAIQNFPKPTNVTEVRSFLGETQYWRKFIANFSFIASPLHVLTSVKQVFHWGGKDQHAFKTLKERIITTPILALSDLQHVFKLETNASLYVMGAFLMQHKKPICYNYKHSLKQ